MTREGIYIRQATKADADAIVAFNASMALETEHRSLDLARLREGVLTLLATPEHGFYVLAEYQQSEGRRVVGQLLITFEWSDWRNGVFWWIQSVYVQPEWRRQGIFRVLHDHIVTLAKNDARVCGVRLYVERENHKAQAVYQRVGLAPAGYTVYEQDFVLGHTVSEKYATRSDDEKK